MALDICGVCDADKDGPQISLLLRVCHSEELLATSTNAKDEFPSGFLIHVAVSASGGIVLGRAKVGWPFSRLGREGPEPDAACRRLACK